MDLLADDAGKRPTYPQYLDKLMNEIAEQDAQFTADIRSPVAWSARYSKMTPERRLRACRRVDITADGRVRRWLARRTSTSWGTAVLSE